jgi:hypothetical protein
MRNDSMHLVRGLSSPPSEARAIICILPTNGRSAHRDAAGDIEGVEGQ